MQHRGPSALHSIVTYSTHDRFVKVEKSRASPGETRLVFYFDVGEHYSRDMTEEMLVITHSLECVYMWAHSECIHTTAMFEDVYILFDSCFIREKFKRRFYAAVCLIS